MTAIVCPAEPGPFVVQAGPAGQGGKVPGDPLRHGVNEAEADRQYEPSIRGIAWEAMMVNSYYGIYQAERSKSPAEIRAAEARLGGLAAEFGQLGSALAAPVRAVRRSLRGQRRAACQAASDAA